MRQITPGVTNNLYLLDDGGMRERIAAFDWSRTALGPSSGWPQSLRSAVAAMLTSPHPMLVWWGPQLIQFYNDAYIPVFGQRHPGGLGQPAAVCWEEVWPFIGARVNAVMEQGAASTGELEIAMTRDGFAEEAYMTFSCGPIFDEAGAVGGLLCAGNDETRRMLGDRRLAALRWLGDRTAAARTVGEVCKQASEVLGAIPRDVPFTLLYLLDEDQETARLQALTGFDQGAAAAPPIIHLGDEGELWPLSSVLATESMAIVSDLRDRFAGPLPSPWPESPDMAFVLPLTPPGGSRLAGFLVAGISPRLVLNESYENFLDLIARQVATALGTAQACERDQQRAAELAAMDRAKAAFFSHVSHEFRTPLTLMLGPLEEALADRRMLPGGRERLNMAQRNGLRLLRLVNTLVDFSRIEAGQVQASYEPADLAAVTADLANSFRTVCEMAGLTLVVDCPSLDEPVYVDREMWSKIVLNLVLNAFKYSFAGEIHVSVRREGDAALLQVRDMGIGIPGPERGRIFERFHRIEGACGRTYEGFGLGLALVRELAALHGGSVDVTSTPGEGSCFTVHLPLGNAHLPAGRIAARRSFASTAACAGAYVEEALRWLPDAAPVSTGEVPFDDVRPSHEAPDRARVLVVDDNADMRDYLSQLLSVHYQVETASGGEEALLAIDRRHPDLVLADAMMPRLDGFGLLRALREQPQTQHLPVILLSAQEGEDAKAQGHDAGAHDYLVKPFSARELLARTAAQLEMARVRRNASAAVRRSEAVLEAALIAGNMAYWHWDPSNNEMGASSTLAALYGLRPDEPWDNNAHSLAALVHPDDLAREKQIAMTAVLEGHGWENQYRIIRPRDGSLAWLEERANPVVDEATGRPIITGFVWDITARKQAEAVIAGQRQALEAALNGGSLESSLGVLIRSAIEQFGSTTRAGFYLARHDEKGMRHIVGMSDEYAAAVDGAVMAPEAAARGLAPWIDQPVLTTDVMTDPLWVPWRPTAERFGYRACWSFPIRCREGQYVGSFCVYWREPREATAHDVDLARLFTRCAGIIISRDIQAELRRKAECRLRTMVEGLPQLVWRAAGDGSWTWASPQWTAFTGLSSEESLGFGWLRALHPADRDRVMAFWRGAAHSGELEIEARIRQQAGGGYRWFQTRAAPACRNDHAVVEWLGSSTDVHELRELQMRQQVLVTELQHRVRNMLTVVRSVFSRTVEADDDLGNAADHFRGRLDALARTQVSVARNLDRNVDLEDLVRDELLSVGFADGPGISISGPDVMLAAHAAETLGLAIHELTTNALKYGALKVAGAKLDIRWVINMDDRGLPVLDLTWQEQGVPAVPVRPAREGFGRELIEEALPDRLGATTSLQFTGGGVCCRISLPLLDPKEQDGASHDEEREP